MENKLHDTIDKIHAEDALKEKTAIYLHEEIRKRGQKSRVLKFRAAAVCVSLVLILIAGNFSYRMYITPSAFVDMDVNPSVELSLNRFGRVLEASPYNDDGAAILQGVSVKNKTYEQAIQMLLDEMILQGYLKPDGLVSVTVQADSSGAEERMLNTIKESVDASLEIHQSDVSTDVFAVSSEVRECAQEHNLSPAKYIAITHLQEVDPEATYDGCSDHSISEIRQLTEEHGGKHHDSEGCDVSEDAGQDGSPAAADSLEQETPEEEAGPDMTCEPEQPETHHEKESGHHDDEHK